MKEIKLTKGMVALVDDEDFERVSEFKWFPKTSKRSYYAMANYRLGKNKRTTLHLHRFIMNNPKGLQVDHINHDGLDNRKENLRACSKKDNIRNQVIRSNNKSGFKGVFFHSQNKNWIAKIRNKHIGVFQDKVSAAHAYNIEASKLFGNFAYLNNI